MDQNIMLREIIVVIKMVVAAKRLMRPRLSGPCR